MTQRAADDYVAIKRALEQIEREKAAALDPLPSDENTAGIMGGIVVPPTSVDEYLGMLGWTHWSADDWAKYRTEAVAQCRKDNNLAPIANGSGPPVAFWFPVAADSAQQPLFLRAGSDEWEIDWDGFWKKFFQAAEKYKPATLPAERELTLDDLRSRPLKPLRDCVYTFPDAYKPRHWPAGDGDAPFVYTSDLT